MANEIERIDPATGEVQTLPATMEQVSLAIGLSKAEIDQQITTAKTYPRSVNRAVQSILSLVTIDEDAAEEATYALPRGGKPITGPSIRMAEIVAGQWGNCRVGARVVHIDRAEKYVEAEGVFHDLETNTATTARVRRRISDKNGRLFSDDMIIVTGNAACAIAKRNAILGGVPKAVWRKAYDAAIDVVKGDQKTLAERRAAVFKAFAAFGVKPEQLFAALGIAGEDDITLEHIPTLTGMRAALKSGEETVETMFGSAGGKAAAGGERKSTRDKMQDIADRKDKGGSDKPRDEPRKASEPEKGRDDKQSREQDDDRRQDRDDRREEGERKVQDSDRDEGGRDEKDYDPPSADDLEIARDRGHDAYFEGRPRTATPREFDAKGREAEKEAWLEGFDSAREGDQDNG